MAATVHPLFPQRPEHPATVQYALVEALQALAAQQLGDCLRGAFDRADDLLFELSERAPNDAERRNYFDTMRFVRLERRQIVDRFLGAIAAGFDAASEPAAVGPAAEEPDFDHLSIQSADVLEARIALDNIAARAEGQCRPQLWELERRLRRGRDERGIPIAPLALHPARLCAAFGTAAAALDAELSVRLVIYKLFEQGIMPALQTLYASALELCARHDLAGEPPRPTGTPVPLSPARRVQPEPLAAPAGPVAADPAPSAMPLTSAADVLRRHGIDPAALSASPDPLASDLGQSLEQLLRLPSLSAVQAATQRLGLASRMFDDWLAEPVLKGTLAPLLEPLRYPAYRAALTDPDFLADAAHPLRQRIAELGELALAAQLGEVPPDQMGALAERVQAEQLGMRRAGLVTLAGTRGLGAHEASVIGNQLRAQAQSRRQMLLQRVRQRVAADIAGRPASGFLPPPAQPLLRSGLAPLLGMRLLRGGRDTPEFAAAESLLDRLLCSVGPAGGGTAGDPADRAPLLDDLRTALADIGMAPSRIDHLLEGLQEAYRLLDADVPSGAAVTETTADAGAGADGGAPGAEETELLLAAFTPPEPAAAVMQEEPAPPVGRGAEAGPPPATTLELLGRILQPESWFRVYEARLDRTRWLRLASFHALQDSVSFSGFDDANRLAMQASQFAQDLADGHSEPVNPTAAMQKALEQLRAALGGTPDPG